jgi:HSP20 family molecular chaperone IbpA
MNLQEPLLNENNVITPLTYVTETGGTICVNCQLHGVPEEEIRIDLERDQLILRATKQDVTYFQKIGVPEGLRITRKKFRDGILEIVLEHLL